MFFMSYQAQLLLHIMKGFSLISAFFGSVLFTSHANAVNVTRPCTASSFSDVSLRGGEILKVSTALITNYSAPSTAQSLNQYPEAVIGLTVCEGTLASSFN